MYTIGDHVAWVSGAGGKSKRKVGQVVYVVQPYQNTVPLKKELSQRYGASVHFDGMVRAHVSYIVLVMDGNRKPKLYHPRVADLHPWHPVERGV